MRRLIILILVISNSILLAEQKKQMVFDAKHWIGFSASSIGGAGLSYKYLMSDFFQPRISGIFYGNKKKDSSRINYNVGLSFELTVVSFHTDGEAVIRGYIAPGISYWYSQRTFNSLYYNNSTVTRKANAGLNIGLEMIMDYRIAGHIEFGYAFYRNLNEFEYQVSPAGAIGIGYMF